MGMKQSKSINDAGFCFAVAFRHVAKVPLKNQLINRDTREEKNQYHVRRRFDSMIRFPLHRSAQRWSKWCRLASNFNNNINDMLIDSGCCVRRTGENINTPIFFSKYR